MTGQLDGWEGLLRNMRATRGAVGWMDGMQAAGLIQVFRWRAGDNVHVGTLGGRHVVTGGSFILSFSSVLVSRGPLATPVREHAVEQDAGTKGSCRRGRKR